MTRTMTVAEMALRELGRRRGVLILLALLPLAAYYSRRGEAYWQSVRFASLGIGWTLSTAALFAGNAARTVEQRLRLAGYAPHQLWLGRLLALWTVGLVLVVPYFLLMRFDLDDVRDGGVALILLLTVAVSAPFGMAVSAVLPREMEGMLVLLTIVSTQMLMNPDQAVAHALPFWFSREIGVYAIEHDAGTGRVVNGCVHAGITVAVCLMVIAVASAVRLRRRGHLSLA
jgi:hypothetical protein